MYDVVSLCWGCCIVGGASGLGETSFVCVTLANGFGFHTCIIRFGTGLLASGDWSVYKRFMRFNIGGKELVGEAAMPIEGVGWTTKRVVQDVCKSAHGTVCLTQPEAGIIF